MKVKHVSNWGTSFISPTTNQRRYHISVHVFSYPKKIVKNISRTFWFIDRVLILLCAGRGRSALSTVLPQLMSSDAAPPMIANEKARSYYRSIGWKRLHTQGWRMIRLIPFKAAMLRHHHSLPGFKNRRSATLVIVDVISCYRRASEGIVIIRQICSPFSNALLKRVPLNLAMIGNETLRAWLGNCSVVFHPSPR